MRSERIDRRVLGALRFLDAVTRAQVSGPLKVEAAGATVFCNASGYYVVAGAAGFEGYTAAFDEPPPKPDRESLSIGFTVRDPARRYLARRVTVAFPRGPDPANAGAVGSLFRPVDVLLYLAPAAAVAPGWAVIRASVVDQAKNPLEGALLRVTQTVNGSELLLARGLSDARGEALVAVPGIPVTTWGAGKGPVTTPTVDVRIRAVFDAGALLPPDPDDLEGRLAGLKFAERQDKLMSGGVNVVPLAIGLI